MALRPRPVQERFPTGRVVVFDNDDGHRQELVGIVRSLGHKIMDAVRDSRPAEGEGQAWADVDLVLVVAGDRDAGWLDQAKSVQGQQAAPPVVVLGPDAASTWRQRALDAGAFLCASRQAPADELRAIFAAAIRYRSLEKEINMLRIECERICMGLLTCYGEAASTLKDTNEEVEVLRQNLSEIRNQIIRAFV